MKILVDMNLSPQWVELLSSGGHECIHWSEVGPFNASDREIMAWARSNGFVVFTHDLDFGAILAATDADFPSILQVRVQDISPQRIGDLVLSVFRQFEEMLYQGALVSIDEKRARARVLPLRRQA
jgi:predicted nuclease of predicted toxin-antitoxin system